MPSGRCSPQASESTSCPERSSEYTPPGTLQSVRSHELRGWIVEAALARGIPTTDSEAYKTRSWRRGESCPTWLLPGEPVVRPRTAQTLPALKRSYWHKRPYLRDFRIRANEYGPFEMATIDPASGRVTNVWWPGDVIDVVTNGASVYLTLPGGLFSARTFLDLRLPSEATAAMLVMGWGWVVDAPEVGVTPLSVPSRNPPVLAKGGERFHFKH